MYVSFMSNITYVQMMITDLKRSKHVALLNIKNLVMSTISNITSNWKAHRECSTLKSLKKVVLTSRILCKARLQGCWY